MASSVTPALKTSARSAYRALFRSSGATFSGDDRVLYAFREKIRTETIAGQQILDPIEYEARVQHAFEVATVLKKNIVQGVKETGETYRLRITSDTELGSNEGVKAPYSRPVRGTPRLKCGEDPNAVVPLLPKSLRSSLGAGSTRHYSTQVQITEELEAEYDKSRVQSLTAKLSQVNRRVSAAPTGKNEPFGERALLEDKLGILAARIEYLAQTQAPAEGHQQALDAFLDVVWLDETDPRVGEMRSDPPVQIRQFVRYLFGAGKSAIDARDAATDLSPGLRAAIGEEVETFAPDTKTLGPVNELRAIIRRMLMIKIGIRKVAAAGGGIGPMIPLQGALQRALSRLTYAQECFEDLEENGPRAEDALSVAEELERMVEVSILSEMTSEIERRSEQGKLWALVDRQRYKFSSTEGTKPNSERARPLHLRNPYFQLRGLETERRPPSLLDHEGHMLWRQNQLYRLRACLKYARKLLSRIFALPDKLTAFLPGDEAQQDIIRFEAVKSAIEPALLTQDKQQQSAQAKQQYSTIGGSVSDWVQLLDELHSDARFLESRIRQTEVPFRGIFKIVHSGECRENKQVRTLMAEARMNLLLAYDLVFRVGKRLRRDRRFLLEMPVIETNSASARVTALDPLRRALREDSLGRQTERQASFVEILDVVANKANQGMS